MKSKNKKLKQNSIYVFLNNNLYLILILLFAFFSRLFVFLKSGIIFWDGAVYIGMGKYFFSNELIGIYEVFRPPIFALILGFLWFIGLDPIFFGGIFILLISVISVFLIYLIGSKIFNKPVGLLSAFFLAVNNTHIFYSGQVLNDNLAVFFILVIIYLLLLDKIRYFFIGVLSAFAFLTRFQNGIILPLIFLYLLLIWCFKQGLFSKNFIANFKKIKLNSYFLELSKWIKVLSGFLLFVIPYIYYNYSKFGNPFLFLIEGSAIIKLVGQSISENIFYYPYYLFLENFLIIFFFVGVYFLFKNFTFKNRVKKFFENFKKYSLHLIILIFIIFSFCYLSYLARKEMRYMIAIIPLVYLYVAIGLHELYLKFKINKRFKNLILILLIIFSLFVMYKGVLIYKNTFISQVSDSTLENYYNYHPNLQNVVLSSPILVAYGDMKPEIIYWTREGMYNYYEKLNVSIYYINTCELFCLESDISCNNGKNEFILKLKENYNQKFYNKEMRCEYYVFEK